MSGVFVGLYPVIIQTLAALALLGSAGALFLLVAQRSASGRARIVKAFEGGPLQPVLGAWVVALVAMTGSLYLSEVVGFPPCVLCWYQRIAMYPLVFVLGAALVTKEPGVWRLALPLPLLGLVISTYHVLLQHRPSLDIVACDPNTPCTVRYVAVFGFVSIPVLAASAFFMITALLLTVGVLQRASADEAQGARDDYS
jgi:disulfide bond formation protein DsbB